MRFVIEKKLDSDAARLAWRLLPANLNSPASHGAALLKEGKLLIKNKVIAATTPQDWEAIALLGRSEQRIAHMNAFIGDAILAFQETGDKALMEAAVQMSSTWTKLHNWSQHAGAMAYHDETTARRVAYWTRLIVATRAVQSGINIDNLHARLLDEVEILSQDSFYAGNNNHGMFQNLALLYYSALLGGNPEYVEKSIGRLLEYFEWSVAEDGVHKEHSPSYNYLIARNMSAHIKLFSYFDQLAGDRMKHLLARMARYAVNIITPDNHYPPLGDTPPHRIPGSYLRTFSEVAPLPSQENFAVFQQGGYAILRDDNKLGTAQTYVVLSASHHGIYHKHADDLSLILYSNGWIISESGPYGYDYSHRFSRHAYSTASHSTLHIPSLSATKTVGKVKIVESSDAGVVSSVRAINQRYPGVLHSRELTFERNSPSLTIKDVIEGGTEHPKYILWQLAPDLAIDIEGLAIQLRRDAQNVAQMTIQGDLEPESLFLNYGDDAKEEILGYQFPDFGHSQKTHVLAVKVLSSTAKAEIITKITLPKQGNDFIKPTVAVSIKNDEQQGAYIEASVTCNDDVAIAYYLNQNGRVVERRAYSAERIAKFPLPPGGGSFSVRVFFKRSGIVFEKINSKTIRPDI